MFKILFKNSITALSFQVVNRGLSFLAFVFIARMLGVEAIGGYAYTLSLSALLSLFVEFGTNQYLIKRAASNGEETLLFDIVNIAVLKLFQFLVGLLILCFFEYKFLIKEFHILNLTLGYVIFEGIAQISISILNGRTQFIRANKILFFYETGRSLILLILLFFLKDLKIVPFVYIFCALIFSIYVSYFVIGNIRKSSTFRGNIGKISKTTIFSYYKLTYLFFISAIAYQLYFRVDMILLKHLSSAFELGVYSTAYKFFEVFLFVPAILSGIIFPSVVSFFSKNKLNEMKDYVKEAQGKFVGILSIGVLLFIISSNLVINLFFGVEYNASVQIMQILFLTSFLYCFNFIYPVILNATGNEKYSIYAFIIGFAINGSLNYLFIPYYGAKAASIITLISECSVTILYYYYLKKKSLEVLHPRALFFIISTMFLASIHILCSNIVGQLQLNCLIFCLFGFLLFCFYKKEIGSLLLINAK